LAARAGKFVEVEKRNSPFAKGKKRFTPEHVIGPRISRDPVG
jgi:hypothetical protein